MKTETIIDAVRDGATTSQEIADAVGRHRNHMTRELLQLTEDGDRYDTATAPLTREMTANGYEYDVNPSWEANRERTAKEPSPEMTKGIAALGEAFRTGGRDDGAPGLMPVNRNYDFESSAYEPSPEATYVPTNGEKEQIEALIAGRNAPGISPHFSIGGPTGCGKTTLAESLAAEHDGAWFEIQMFPDMSSADLLGSPSISPTGTVWADGTLVKALLCSQERLTFLLIDEANRAPARVSNILFNALDHRCRVTLDGPRGGETIQGNPDNLVVFSTLNIGSQYTGTHDMDAAQKRRLGFKFNTDYLSGEREASLISDRAGISKTLAQDMVDDVATGIRETANDPTDMKTNIDIGIPTAAMVSWAAAALELDRAGISDPLVVAAESAVIEPYYGDDPDAADTVREMISSVFAGAPVDEKEYAAHAEDERVYCVGCDFEVPRSEAEDADLLVDHECPDCSEHLRTYTRD